jgi:hypothetical protein
MKSRRDFTAWYEKPPSALAPPILASSSAGVGGGVDVAALAWVWPCSPCRRWCS